MKEFVYINRYIGVGIYKQLPLEVKYMNDLKLNKDINVVTVNGRKVSLTNQETALLDTLIENHDTTLSRDCLLKDAWGYKSAGITRTVDVHIQRLRQKIGTNMIETVHRSGYRLNLNPA